MVSNWEVYIIQAENGRLYTGITTDLTKRFAAHQNRKGARFFRFSDAKSLLFRENHPDRSSATRREILIKKMSRDEKMKLIEKTAPLKE